MTAKEDKYYGRDAFKTNYPDLYKQIKEEVKQETDSKWLECLNKFKEGNWCSLPGQTCIRCKKRIFRVYHEVIINGELVEFCPDCWVKECFGEEGVK